MLKGQILGIWTSGVSVSSLEHAVCRMPTVATTLQSSVAQTTKTITSATAAPMSTSPTLTPTAVRAGRLSKVPLALETVAVLMARVAAQRMAAVVVAVVVLTLAALRVL